jgi:hypothetical protein
VPLHLPFEIGRDADRTASIGPKTSVTVSADEELLPQIRTEVRGAEVRFEAS